MKIVQKSFLSVSSLSLSSLFFASTPLPSVLAFLHSSPSWLLASLFPFFIRCFFNSFFFQFASFLFFLLKILLDCVSCEQNNAEIFTIS